MKKRYFFVYLIITLLVTFVSCNDGVEDNTPKKATVVPVSLVIESDKSVYGFGDSVSLSISSISEEIPDEKIKWYVNGELQSDKGSSISVTTTSVNQEVKVCAKVEKENRVFSSNTISYKVTNCESLYDYVMDYIDTYKIQTGLSVSVYSKNEDIDFVMSCGYASVDKKIKNTDSIYHPLCSLSKSFTGAAINKMVHDGKINLSDTVDDLLGDYYTFDEEKINVDATVQQLLEHRSGIYDFIGSDVIVDMFCYYTKYKIILAVVGGSYPYADGWSPEIVLNYATANFDNVGTFKYSSLNYVLLGLIIDKHSGSTFEQYVRTNFMQPLGISASDIIMVPRESVNFNNVASAHFNPELYSDYISDTVMNLLPLIGIKKGINDMRSVVPDIQEMMCKLAWAGGGFVGTVRPCSLWIYNLMSPYGITSSTDTNLAYFKNIKIDLDNLTCSSPKYSYGMYVGSDLYNHGGQGVGTWNTMRYYPENDIAVVVFSDSTPDSSGTTQNVEALANGLADIAANLGK